MDSAGTLQQPVTALPDRVQTWRWRSIRGSFCRELRTFRQNGETTSGNYRFASQQLERSSEKPVQQATTQETLVEASWLLIWFMYVCVAQQAAEMLYGLWHNRRFASQQLEHSSEEPNERSYCFSSCMYVWFGSKYHHITCF